LRKICYISGTRADFGLMRSTLAEIGRTPGLSVETLVTGMHLDEKYGNTYREIEASGIAVRATVRVPLQDDSRATMACNIARQLEGFVASLSTNPPDCLLLLGDRGEQLAGAIAGVHLNIVVAHIHGGERSGTVDELIRHAISKLSHYHFVATEESRERLVRMGELPSRVFVTGAPGLDELRRLTPVPRDELCSKAGLDPSRAVALVLFHPVVQSADASQEQIGHVISGVRQAIPQVVGLLPNSDAGNRAIREAMMCCQKSGEWVNYTHLPRNEFLSWMAAADVMVGNSSSGIIEAASFGTPVINVGDRQRLRERNANVTDVPVESGAIAAAITSALKRGRFPSKNVYGDGFAAERIARALRDIPLGPEVLNKCNAY
jgi:GDP/UDP-N,N'-diacetylbacillosamine 2-epimerase (hydrolysing)